MVKYILIKLYLLLVFFDLIKFLGEEVVEDTELRELLALLLMRGKAIEALLERGGRGRFS